MTQRKWLLLDYVWCLRCHCQLCPNKQSLTKSGFRLKFCHMGVKTEEPFFCLQIYLIIFQGIKLLVSVSCQSHVNFCLVPKSYDITHFVSLPCSWFLNVMQHFPKTEHCVTSKKWLRGRLSFCLLLQNLIHVYHTCGLLPEIISLFFAHE